MQIDLKTVETVKVSPVHGDTHVGRWPAKNKLMSIIGEQPASVRHSKILHHCNGNAYEQERYIAVDIIVSKPFDPDLEQLLTDYINAYCK